MVDDCVGPARVQLVNCGLSPATVAKLEEKGITALFPIQKHVFEPVMAGRDLIGRARTGSGKTLAFALPVIENLVKVAPGPVSAACKTRDVPWIVARAAVSWQLLLGQLCAELLIIFFGRSPASIAASCCIPTVS